LLTLSADFDVQWINSRDNFGAEMMPVKLGCGYSTSTVLPLPASSTLASLSASSSSESSSSSLFLSSALATSSSYAYNPTQIIHAWPTEVPVVKSWYKGSNASSVRIPVVDEQRTSKLSTTFV